MGKESFDDEFCDVLNGYLMSAMSTFDHKLARSCWMDGVLMPFVELLSKKRINDTRKIETHVWALTGKGDIKFDLIIYFGKYSLRRYAKGSSLDDCLPLLDSTDHISVDFEKERIELRLL